MKDLIKKLAEADLRRVFGNDPNFDLSSFMEEAESRMANLMPVIEAHYAPSLPDAAGDKVVEERFMIGDWVVVKGYCEELDGDLLQITEIFEDMGYRFCKFNDSKGYYHGDENFQYDKIVCKIKYKSHPVVVDFEKMELEIGDIMGEYKDMPNSFLPALMNHLKTHLQSDVPIVDIRKEWEIFKEQYSILATNDAAAAYKWLLDKYGSRIQVAPTSVDAADFDWKSKCDELQEYIDARELEFIGLLEEIENLKNK